MKLNILLPGSSFTGGFMDSIIALLNTYKNEEVTVYRSAGSNIYHVRESCLRGNPPFKGKDYDYLLWIDSDMVFTPEHVKKLIEDDKDMIGAVAMLTDSNYNVGRNEGFEQCYDYLGLPENQIIEAGWIGFGMVLMKKGVVEKIPLPRFEPIKHGDVIMSEDVSFCVKARQKGFKIYADTGVRIGHEKRIIL